MSKHIPFAEIVGRAVLTMALCLAAGELHFRAPFVAGADALVWLPGAAALGAMVAFGVDMWPAVVIAALLATWRLVPPPAALVVAASDTAGAVLGAAIIRRFAGASRAFERPRHVLVALLAIVVASIGAATAGMIGVTAVGTMKGPADDLWTNWALSTAAADVLLMPVLVLWLKQPRFGLTRRTRLAQPPTARKRARRALAEPHPVEGALLAVTGMALAPIMFAGIPPAGTSALPVLFFYTPLLCWSALRFGPRATATLLALCGGVAIWGVLHARGPFAASIDPTSAVQAFVLISGLTGLLVVSAVESRNRADAELHQLAVTDPVTGLANFRHLVYIIRREIERSRRHTRSFSVVVLDVDNLKTVNDRDGHAVGNRLLERLADALRTACRVTDLIARQGGDEFAVVFPACGEQEARAQISRIRAAIAADTEAPPISVSLGVSVFPRDGDSAEELLDRADAELYAMKAAKRAAGGGGAATRN